MAVNAGSNVANNGVPIPTTDQRGAGRNGTTDIGAYEIWPGDDASLPVELSSFAVCQEKNSVVIEWRTESEIENLGFILERRTEILSHPEFVEGWNKIASYQECEELQGAGSKSSATDYKFTDKNVIPGITYEYRLSDVSYDGVVERHGIRKITVKMETFDAIPETFMLYGAYPNPFNPVTTISYQIAEPAYVKLSIYDISGRLIDILVNEQKNAGYFSIEWNAEDAGSGFYFYRIDAGNFSCVKKCLVIK